MTNKYTIETMQEFAEKRRGQCLSKRYYNSREKLVWQCKKKHVWNATPRQAFREWCPVCNGKKSRKRIFIIGDLHLGHTNIIKYCNRPFESTEEMNRTLISNWNKTIGKNDLVYYLGDISFGKGSGRTHYWPRQLNGEIIFLKGNHDKTKLIGFAQEIILEYRKHKFLLLHVPSNIPKSWKHWSIHGHVHNNHLNEYPFINGKEKTINVSVELIGYRPLQLDKLFELDFENIERMETLESEPVKRS